VLTDITGDEQLHDVVADRELTLVDPATDGEDPGRLRRLVERPLEPGAIGGKHHPAHRVARAARATDDALVDQHHADGRRARLGLDLLDPVTHVAGIHPAAPFPSVHPLSPPPSKTALYRTWT